MTDRAPTARTPRPRRRKPSAYPIVAGSLAAFVGLSGFLAYQLRMGHDPALGGKVAVQQVVAPKRIVLKRIEHHIVVTKVIPPPEEGDDGQSAPVRVALAPQQSAPVVTRSAPVVVQSAPAPAPVAAPVVTKSS